MSSSIVRSWGVRQPDLLQPGDGVERVAGADFGQRAAVEQLQELNDEFDVADAAVAGFDVAQVAAFALGALLDAALERLDAGDVGEAEVAAIDPRLEPVEQLAAQVEVAGDRPGFDERLPLPGAALHVVVGERAVEAQAERAARAFGPQPQVDAVGDAQVGRLGEQADEFFAEPLEELLVADRAAGVGLAVLLVEEDEVDVAGVVQLDAAELAEAEDDEAAALAVAAERLAVVLFQVSPGVVEGRFDDGVGQVGDLPGDGCDRLAADDVAIGDAQRFAALEAAERRRALRL